MPGHWQAWHDFFIIIFYFFPVEEVGGLGWRRKEGGWKVATLGWKNLDEHKGESDEKGWQEGGRRLRTGYCGKGFWFAEWGGWERSGDAGQCQGCLGRQAAAEQSALFSSFLSSSLRWALGGEEKTKS